MSAIYVYLWCIELYVNLGIKSSFNVLSKKTIYGILQLENSYAINKL